MNLLRYSKEGNHVDDFGTILLEVPKIIESFIVEESCHIRDLEKQKNVASGLKKMLEIDELLCCDVATTDDENQS